MEKLKLPLNRSAYTSFMGIGGYDGYEKFDGDELELGVNVSGERALTKKEMEDILAQHERAAKKSEPSEEVKRLKQRQKDLQQRQEDLRKKRQKK